MGSNGPNSSSSRPRPLTDAKNDAGGRATSQGELPVVSSGTRCPASCSHNSKEASSTGRPRWSRISRDTGDGGPSRSSTSCAPEAAASTIGDDSSIPPLAMSSPWTPGVPTSSSNSPLRFVVPAISRRRPRSSQKNVTRARRAGAPSGASTMPVMAEREGCLAGAGAGAAFARAGTDSVETSERGSGDGSSSRSSCSAVTAVGSSAGIAAVDAPGARASGALSQMSTPNPMTIKLSVTIANRPSRIDRIRSVRPPLTAPAEPNTNACLRNHDRGVSERPLSSR
jgi:hypothetical protein